jgi:hypothetical protein
MRVRSKIECFLLGLALLVAPSPLARSNASQKVMPTLFSHAPPLAPPLYVLSSTLKLLCFSSSAAALSFKYLARGTKKNSVSSAILRRLS